MRRRRGLGGSPPRFFSGRFRELFEEFDAKRGGRAPSALPLEPRLYTKNYKAHLCTTNLRIKLISLSGQLVSP